MERPKTQVVCFFNTSVRTPFLNISDATKEQGKEGKKRRRRRLLVYHFSVSSKHDI